MKRSKIRSPHLTIFSVTVLLLLLQLVFPFYNGGGATRNKQASADAKKTVRTAAPAGSSIYQTLAQSFEKAIEIENKKLHSRKHRLSQLQDQQKELQNLYGRYQTMISTQSNLLLLPSTELQALEQAATQQSVALNTIQKNLSEFADKESELDQAKQEAAEQIAFYKNQVEGIKGQTPKTPVYKDLLNKLNTLIDLMTAREKAIGSMIDIYAARQKDFSDLEKDVSAVAAKFQSAIEQKKKSRILNRTESPLIQIFKGGLRGEPGLLFSKIKSIAALSFWHKPDEVTWDAYSMFLATFLILLSLMEAVLYLFSWYCGRMKEKCHSQENFWQYVTMRLLQRSLPIVGAVTFLYFYPIQPVYLLTPLFALKPLLIRFLIILLGVQWGLVFIRAIREESEDPLFLKLYPLLRIFFYGLLVFGAGYIMVGRILCENCLGLVTWRLLFEAALVIWAIYFLRVFRRGCTDTCLMEHSWYPHLRPVIIICGYLVVVPGLLFDLAGFGGLAVYIYTAVGKTVAVVFWWLLLLKVMRETGVSSPIEKEESDEDETEAEEKPYPVRWVVYRILRLAMLAIVFTAIPLAWGAQRTFLADIFYAFNYKISIGSIRLSVIGILYAVLVLIMVNTLSVIWQSILKYKILLDAKFEPGLKDSITRITVYALWLIGILVAMRVIGISTTSLTVVFGAVGIGLGFGLQNIFNNFVSGIILLFERPIQVGDVIEINGIWGMVKEINVRSTHVKTYDNADLIIPNSDFVSQQLTNWSFRDARVRRSVTVGVAYGSDVGLVRETLSEIAYKHSRVLRRPHPEVLFTDFGDSALIFKLRFWTHVDYVFSAETDIRFDIDKRFRELGITIPFPQRDVYIKEVKGRGNAGEVLPDAH